MNWLTRVFSPTPKVATSQRTKWSIPLSRPTIALGVPVEPDVKYT